MILKCENPFPIKHAIEIFLIKIKENVQILSLENRIPISEFLEDTIDYNKQNKIVDKILSRSTARLLNDFPVSFLLDHLNSFAVVLRNSVGVEGKWSVKWKPWDIFSDFTTKLVNLTYSDRFQKIKARLFVSALQDCNKYFVQYFQLLKLIQEVRVKNEIMNIYEILIEIIHRATSEEKSVLMIKRKYQSVYKSWLSSQENLFRVKKNLGFDPNKTDFYIPSIPLVPSKETDEIVEGKQEFLGSSKSHLKVRYDMDFEDKSNNEIDIVVKLGALIQEVVDDLKSEALSGKINKDITNQAYYNNLILNVISEKYKILFDSHERKCMSFLKKLKSTEEITDEFSKLVQHVKLCEEFMIDCLQKYCTELELYQKVFSLQMTQVSSQALLLYKTSKFQNFFKSLII